MHEAQCRVSDVTVGDINAGLIVRRPRVAALAVGWVLERLGG
jgi:hypothetical protein